MSSRDHRKLKERAVSWLESLGVSSIFQEYRMHRDGMPSCRTDVVGFLGTTTRPDSGIVVECGDLTSHNLLILKKHFLAVFHWPYGSFEKPHVLGQCEQCKTMLRETLGGMIDLYMLARSSGHDGTRTKTRIQGKSKCRVRVAGKSKYVYWPAELRRKGFTGSFEVFQGMSGAVLVLVNDEASIDEPVEDLDVIFGALKLKKKSLSGRWV